MASVSNRGPHQWQVIVRRKGYPSQTETFRTKAQAESWGRQIEAQMDIGTFRDRRALAGITLGDALERYLSSVTPTKRAPTAEINRVKQLLRHQMARRLIVSLQAKDFSSYRDQRLKAVGSNAVRLELALLSHVYTVAIKEWSWPLTHELKSVSKPKAADGRERRLEGDEEQRLRKAIRRPRASAAIWLEACVDLAIETGMRACEILSLTWSQVDLENSCVRLEETKNGSRRTVGLTSKAESVLQNLPRIGATVINAFYDTPGLDAAFARARKAAGIRGLNFHDLRHEAASRFAPTMQTHELAKIMGWKTLQMAMRYYNQKDSEIVEIVRRRTLPQLTSESRGARRHSAMEYADVSSFAPKGAVTMMSFLVK